MINIWSKGEQSCCCCKKGKHYFDSVAGKEYTINGQFWWLLQMLANIDNNLLSSTHPQRSCLERWSYATWRSIDQCRLATSSPRTRQSFPQRQVERRTRVMVLPFAPHPCTQGSSHWAIPPRLCSVCAMFWWTWGWTKGHHMAVDHHTTMEGGRRLMALLVHSRL